MNISKKHQFIPKFSPKSNPNPNPNPKPPNVPATPNFSHPYRLWSYQRIWPQRRKRRNRGITRHFALPMTRSRRISSRFLPRTCDSNLTEKHPLATVREDSRRRFVIFAVISYFSPCKKDLRYLLLGFVNLAFNHGHGGVGDGVGHESCRRLWSGRSRPWISPSDATTGTNSSGRGGQEKEKRERRG